MSYSTPENAWFHDTHDKSEYLISSTPMVYDIAAIQYLYGAARYNEGNTSYKYDRDQPFVETIGTLEATIHLIWQDLPKTAS